MLAVSSQEMSVTTGSTVLAAYPPFLPVGQPPLASQRLLGTREIVLIHHTDCGMLTFTDDQFKRSIQDETGIKPPWSAEAFTTLDEDVRQSIARIKASPFVPHKDQIRGFVFDVATGKLNEVT